MFHNGMDAVKALKTCEEILTDEIEGEEFLKFAINNLSEMMGYIAQGNLNIRIHRDIAGDMWFWVGRGVNKK